MGARASPGEQGDYRSQNPPAARGGRLAARAGHLRRRWEGAEGFPCACVRPVRGRGRARAGCPAEREQPLTAERGGAGGRRLQRCEGRPGEGRGVTGPSPHSRFREGQLSAASVPPQGRTRRGAAGRIAAAEPSGVHMRVRLLTEASLTGLEMPVKNKFRSSEM